MKKTMILLLIFSIAFPFVACHKNESNLEGNMEAANKTNSQLEYNAISESVIDQASEIDRPQLSEEQGGNIDKFDLRQKMDKEYIRAVNDFSNRISPSLLSGQEDNKMISPISIQMALALACAGAEGSTREEITNILGFHGMDMMELNNHNKNLYNLLQADDGISKLHIGNSLWLNDKANFYETYLMNAIDYYFADLYEVDFMDQATANLMSDWVSKQTGNLINPHIMIAPQQLLSIMNTIYYKDEWMIEFEEDETESAPFYRADGTTVECDYMFQTRNPYSYYKGEGYLSFALGLKGRGQMHFILPDEGVTTDELLAKPEHVSKAFFEENYSQVKIIYRIPKFSFGSEFSLQEILEEMGMVEAFTINANFSAMTDEETMFISNISHQTHIGIDEKGVEAAAFTEIRYFGAGRPQEELIEITLNRPFLFAITTEEVILFMGVVNNPLDQ